MTKGFVLLSCRTGMFNQKTYVLSQLRIWRKDHEVTKMNNSIVLGFVVATIDEAAQWVMFVRFKNGEGSNEARSLRWV